MGPVEGLVIDNDQASVLIGFPIKHSPMLPIAEEIELTQRAALQAKRISPYVLARQLDMLREKPDG